MVPFLSPMPATRSGVDATIADQSSYMTHVFGLRGADTFDTKNHSSKIASNARTSRIPSDSTNRSASSSSYLSTGALSDFPPASSNAMKVPVMVRDSTQVIGLKKVASMDGSTLDLLLHTGNSNMLRPHVDIRSQLGIGKPLSPIPGSPPPAHSLNVGIDTAIHSANAPVWQGVTEQSDFVSLALIDPTTNAIVNVRVPKSQYSSALGGVPCEILSTASKSNPSHQNAASKADASANWRNRASALSSAHASQAHTAGFANSPPPVSSPHSPVKPSVEVLTVDQLSQKYGHMRVDPNTVAEKTTTNKKGEKPASETTSPAKMLADSTSRQINIDATPVKSMKRKNLRIATNKRISSPSTTRIKGTPGAGKLLKPVVTVETDTSVKPNATAATQ
ncbi:hypothetical protein CC85DRAFT_314224 [Cutaneotrichosporon oleaginosum]|uniref:Uncharacterized protein n=1 Tax=Cutaneotrichosporon oleaginosum TaxID=879819 RepID=A0A0J0XCL9_9TREE|nr:uncharacterized protein CC85DRAFT_314224 [Cutaneotrichosporon oleaginosum]KLT38811.1 hypothetical protein CC85DRAFT_314224 [Cutaneotrichosporon oleaginosum]